MQRNITKELIKWKDSTNRMPLIVYGPRHVGKTYSIVDFGIKHFRNLVYVNFEVQVEFGKVFEFDLDSDRIINELSILSGIEINSQTLIFFDKIHACGKALTSLKYFCENRPDIPIIAAGSLLGTALASLGYSFPVGKVSRLNMYPMGFDEFLLALNENALLEYIQKRYDNNEELAEVYHNKALDLVKKYLVVGGYPKVVSEFINNNIYVYIMTDQVDIIASYLSDMSKYCKPLEASRVRATYLSISNQLTKENSKFVFSLIGSGARVSTYESCLAWLIDGGYIIKTSRAKEGKLPLGFYSDITSHKIYLNDVGLLRAYLYYGNMNEPRFDKLIKEYREALIENYVAQALHTNNYLSFYWESSNSIEIDFIIQMNAEIVPIECKAGSNTKSPNLSSFTKKYNIDYSIRITQNNFEFKNGIKSIPLYAVWCIKNKVD